MKQAEAKAMRSSAAQHSQDERLMPEAEDIDL
ncbi:hypothetical protein N826_21155 [Skermanella aerolata KACC 11604]|nr:hypothetical protein N826_21155 [Skermanella aerolata KACC 11604]